jgi:hypothetical protein
MLAPARRGTFLVLMGAFLVSVALTVGVAVRGPTPVAVSAPEPVVPAGDTPSGDAPPRPSFRAVAGPACPVNASQDVRISAGWQGGARRQLDRGRLRRPVPLLLAG